MARRLTRQASTTPAAFSATRKRVPGVKREQDRKLLTCGNDEADPARRRIGFIVLLSQTTRAREDSNL